MHLGLAAMAVWLALLELLRCEANYARSIQPLSRLTAQLKPRDIALGNLILIAPIPTPKARIVEVSRLQSLGTNQA